MLHSYIMMSSSPIQFGRKMVLPVWLPAILCLFLFGQIVAGGHFHESELDASDGFECAICLQTAQSEDLDLPDVVEAQSLDFVELWQIETVTSQPSVMVLEEKARDPPYS